MSRFSGQSCSHENQKCRFSVTPISLPAFRQNYTNEHYSDLFETQFPEIEKRSGLILKTGRKLLKFKNTICDKKSAELELKKYVAFIGLVSEKGRLSICFDVGTTFYFLIFWFFFSWIKEHLLTLLKNLLSPSRWLWYNVRFKTKLAFFRTCSATPENIGTHRI